MDRIEPHFGAVAAKDSGRADSPKEDRDLTPASLDPRPGRSDGDTPSGHGAGRRGSIGPDWDDREEQKSASNTRSEHDDYGVRPTSKTAASNWLGSLLRDPLARLAIGPKFEVFAARWSAGYGRASNEFAPALMMRPTSMLDAFRVVIWPALFFGGFWLAYRKMYLAAALILAASFCFELLPPNIGKFFYIAYAPFCLAFGSACYLARTRDLVRTARSMGSAEAADAYVRQRAGTSWIAAVVAVVATIFIGMVEFAALEPQAFRHLTGSFLGCTTTDIAARMSDLNASILEEANRRGVTSSMIQKQNVLVAGSNRIQAAFMRGDMATACKLTSELEQRLK